MQDENATKDNCKKFSYIIDLPKCTVCGKSIKEGFQSKDKFFCSKDCYNSTLIICSVCGKPLDKGYVDEKGMNYCSDDCLKSKNPGIVIDMNEPLNAKELSYLTGLSIAESATFMEVNNLNGDEAFCIIDEFAEYVNSGVDVPLEIAACLNNAGIYSKMAANLGKLNVRRGGIKGYSGFVFEELYGAEASLKGQKINVLNNNGIADYELIKKSGEKVYLQAKAGYKPGQIDWDKYKEQPIVVDKGNYRLAEDAKSHGLKVIMAETSKKEAQGIAKIQQIETKFTGNKNAPVTATGVGAYKAGIESAKFAARVGVSLKLGENIYDVIDGKKDFKEATASVAKDGIIIAGGAFVSSAAGTVVSTAGVALTQTAVGSALVTGAETAIAAIASTTVGGAVLSTLGAVSSSITAVVTTITNAPLLPIVGICVAVGFVSKWVSDCKNKNKTETKKQNLFINITKEALAEMENRREELKRYIEHSNRDFDNVTTQALGLILNSAAANNIEGIVIGINNILSIIDKKADFETLTQYDEHFFSDEILDF